jgi:hypothetical protein
MLFIEKKRFLEKRHKPRNKIIWDSYVGITR